MPRVERLRIPPVCIGAILIEICGRRAPHSQRRPRAFRTAQLGNPRQRGDAYTTKQIAAANSRIAGIRFTRKIDRPDRTISHFSSKL